MPCFQNDCYRAVREARLGAPAGRQARGLGVVETAGCFVGAGCGISSRRAGCSFATPVTRESRSACRFVFRTRSARDAFCGIPSPFKVNQGISRLRAVGLFEFRPGRALILFVAGSQGETAGLLRRPAAGLLAMTELKWRSEGGSETAPYDECRTSNIEPFTPNIEYRTAVFAIPLAGARSYIHYIRHPTRWRSRLRRKLLVFCP